jgi:pimeloyl-ACP methyl ester carboxylesterase
MTLALRAKYEDECDQQYLKMSDTTELLVLRTYASHETHNGFTILMVPGWGSIVPGWDEFLLEAKKDFDVIYLETREKGSSKIFKTSQRGSMHRLSDDIAEVISQLGLDQTKLILFGSCMGANIIAHGLVYGKLDPFMSYLIGPQPKWPIPRISRFVLPIAPKWFLTPIKPFLRYWLIKTQCDTPETAAKYSRVLNEANSRKWHHVGLPIAFETYQDLFARIRKKVAIVAEQGDKTHIPEDTFKIAQIIPNAELIVMKSNKAAHSVEMVDCIRKRMPVIKFS